MHTKTHLPTYTKHIQNRNIHQKIAKQQSENRFKDTVLNSCCMQGTLHKLQIDFLNKI